jgi:hypothetical protein
MAAKTLVHYTDHERKNIFRTLWAKPLIQYLHEVLGKKLVYMGLPGIGAFDIKEWIDCLDIVFAYQCLDEDKEYAEAEREFQVLSEFLNNCTVKGTLKDYGLYKGYLEQVVMTGYDDSGQEFNQNDYITVYNLDFCNTLTKPFPVVYPNGKTVDCYKLDAIDKLIQYQLNVEAEKKSDKFLMFITVNSDFLERNYDDIVDRKFQKYRTRINNNTINPSRQARLIKAYTYHFLNQIFLKYNFQAEFLPPMYYEGSGGYRDPKTNQWRPTMMLTFTILGTNVENFMTPVVNQNVDEYLALKFLYASNTALSCHTERRITETDFNPDPIDMLQKSITVKNLWI